MLWERDKLYYNAYYFKRMFKMWYIQAHGAYIEKQANKRNKIKGMT